MSSRLAFNLALACLCAAGAGLVPAAAAMAAPLPAVRAVGSDGVVRASARREGLAVVAVRPAGPGELRVACGGALAREAFLKRASLVAYAAFRDEPALRAIVFEHAFGGSRQVIRVGASDLADYLADRIPRPEYHRRVTREHPSPPRSGPTSLRPPAGKAVRLPAPPALPRPAVPVPLPMPAPDLPLSQAPHEGRGGRPAPHPVALPLPAAIAPPAVAPTPVTPFAVPPATTDVSFAWSLGLGRAAYDAYTVEYDHAVLPTLSVRPALWILSGFSPLNRMAGPSAGMDGLSAAVDVVGSTRKQVGPAGLALEGGLGLRATALQSAPGAWPAAHLRVGARWQALGLAMRYPLLARGGDPTATWEASLGLAWSFGGAAPQ